MTPKQKATDLVSKFFKESFINKLSLSDFNLAEIKAKNRALICVDEIISSREKIIFNISGKTIKDLKNSKREINESMLNDRLFWQSVKEEIIKL